MLFYLDDESECERALFDQRRPTGAIFTHDANARGEIGGEINVVQNRRVRFRVGECHIVELHDRSIQWLGIRKTEVHFLLLVHRSKDRPERETAVFECGNVELLTVYPVVSICFGLAQRDSHCNEIG